MTKTIRFRLNGKFTTLETDGSRTLLWVLRDDLGLSGTKFGCGEGICGACTVVVDGEAVRSCSVPVSSVDGREVITIEGLAGDGARHPLQQAFVDHGGFQCGYCTPGMIMNAYALLRANPKASRDAIVKGMEDNLCRCGAHQRILAAIEDVARGKGGAS
ncbi:MAG: ferredoxin [Acidobacteria bacterium 21-70-11]|nr:MAG: ferredoxin [Acidobacteria bacterium 21-70-11]HQU33438.1 (2Fe-2S)-binding protein [Thermoanaerobaculaceae bacterium]